MWSDHTIKKKIVAIINDNKVFIHYCLIIYSASTNNVIVRKQMYYFLVIKPTPNIRVYCFKIIYIHI